MGIISAVIVNVYYKNPSLRALRKRLRQLSGTVVVASEAQKLGRIGKGYRRHSAPKYMPDHVREVAVYTKKSFNLHGVLWRIATNAAGKGAHPRTIVEVRGADSGVKWSIIAVHNNPTRRGAGAKQSVRLMRQVTRLVRQAKKDGYTPIVMGDFNRRPEEKGKGTQHYVARVTGGTVKQERLDGAVVPSGLRVSGWRVFKTPGGDHPLIRAIYVKTRRS